MTRVNTVRKRLRSKRGLYPQIAAETRLGVEWLRKFSQGKLVEPGATKLDRLERWLDNAS